VVSLEEYRYRNLKIASIRGRAGQGRAEHGILEETVSRALVFRGSVKT